MMLPAPSTPPPPEDVGDPAIRVARTRENLAVGDRLVRFRLSTRLIHWGVAGTFVGCLVTGLPIWSPLFGWLGSLVGGLRVCRWLHPWTGIAFSVLIALQAVHWAAEMRFTPPDWRFIGLRNFVDYLRWRGRVDDVGKFNGGQKVLFWLSELAALGVLATGIVLWQPQLFGPGLRQVSWFLHDATFILFALLIMGHVYLVIVEPGTFQAMVGGTVSRDWAELNHPVWFHDVTKDR